jgi:hypothetical protein
VWRELSTLQAATCRKVVGWEKINVILYLYNGVKTVDWLVDLASFRLEGGSNINKQKGNTS